MNIKYSPYSVFRGSISPASLYARKKWLNEQYPAIKKKAKKEDADRKVFLILDNLRVYHSYKSRDWLEEHTDQIEVFFLPSYSPELNPDEYLNCD